MSNSNSLLHNQYVASLSMTPTGEARSIPFVKVCEICGAPAMEGMPKGLPSYCQRHVLIIARIIELTGDKEWTGDETRQFVAQAESEAEKVLGGQGQDQHQRDEEQPTPLPTYPPRDSSLRDQMDHPASPVAQNRTSNSQGLEVSEHFFSPLEDPTPSLSAEPARERPVIPSEALRKGKTETKHSRNDVASDDPTHSGDGTGKRIIEKGDILTVLGVLVVGVLIPVLGLNIFLSSVGMRPYQLWPSPDSLAGITLNSQLDVFLIPFLVLLLIVLGIRWLNKH